MTGTVVLFAGHRIDEPDRNPPRFPPACEATVRAGLEAALTDIAAAEGPVLGIAGAADGGDILFHEVCGELGIVSEVCLALPAAEYVQTSVQLSWRERFFRILDSHPTAILGAAAGDVWELDHEWQMSRARERAPGRTILLALSSKADGDIPGGTSGMIRMARESGFEVIELDAKKLCG